MKITKILARQILDSRGDPTVEVDVYLEDNSFGRAAVPSGASTGEGEALELRDQDPKFYFGKGVLKAVENINSKIAQRLIGEDAEEQEKIDQLMIDLDATENKRNLGANAILAVSLATAKATSLSQNRQFYEYIAYLTGNLGDYLLPLPMMNIINGGKHANWASDIQEFMIIPHNAKSFSHALQIGSEVFHSLAKVLETKGYPTTVADEGGFAPRFKKGNQEAFELITNACEKAGYSVGKDIVFAIDAAASEVYRDGKYHLQTENKNLSSAEMIAWYQTLKSNYPIISIEDGLDQKDWEGWKKLNKSLGEDTQIVGDDLLVTNVKFLQKAIKERAANSILIKLNQIGTLTETIQTVEMAKKANWKPIISHRSGETEDTTIAHLAVGLAAGQIKTGSLSRTDRIAKYNELLRIEEHLGPNATYASNFKK